MESYQIILSYDCSTDDARLTLETALDAVKNGATIATYTKVVGYVYENNHFQNVTLCGYVTDADKKYAGYSPDGLIGEDGLIEIKCPGHIEYIRTLIERDVPKRYQAQMQWGMMLTGRSWCDYVVYNPDFESKTMFVERVERDELLIDLLLENYLVFENQVNQMLDKLN